jgi:hypothetical protein
MSQVRRRGRSCSIKRHNVEYTQKSVDFAALAVRLPSKVNAAIKLESGHRGNIAIVGTHILHPLSHRTNAPKHVDTGVSIQKEHQINPFALSAAFLAEVVCETRDQLRELTEKSFVAKASFPLESRLDELHLARHKPQNP